MFVHSRTRLGCSSMSRSHYLQQNFSWPANQSKLSHQHSGQQRRSYDWMVRQKRKWITLKIRKVVQRYCWLWDWWQMTNLKLTEVKDRTRLQHASKGIFWGSKQQQVDMKWQEEVTSNRQKVSVSDYQWKDFSWTVWKPVVQLASG